MESAFLIAAVAAVVYVLWRLGARMQQLHRRFDGLDQDLREIRHTLSQLQAGAGPLPEVKPAPTEAPSPAAVRSPAAAPAPAAITAQAPAPPQAAYSPPAAPVHTPPTGPATRPGLVARFLRNNPDLEKFIGENLINKIGIAILVLGIGYFVKFAIDQDWINETGRVAIGMLAGGTLLGLAHRLRHTLPAFSSVLVGGGLAVLYFTIAIAFHQYGLFSQAAAFVVMVLITAFSILLSVSYNRKELAVLSLLGGFATPFMLSSGQDNYQVLFTYILILNAGMLVLAYLRGWKILNWIAFVCTALLYGGWLSTQVIGQGQGPLAGALAFGTLFYLVFFAMNIVNNLKEQARFAASDISILLSNTFGYYAAGMLVLAAIRQGLYQGLFTEVLALFNFVFAYGLLRNRGADRNLIFLLIGLVITFASLAIPVQLEGNFITLFWSMEAVLLLWLYLKSELKLIFLSSLVVLGLMVVSLVMDWVSFYWWQAGPAALPVVANKAFITSLVALAALALTIRLLRRLRGTVAFRYLRVDVRGYRHLAGAGLAVLLYFALALELHYQLKTHLSYSLERSILLGSYNLAFLASLLAFARRKNRPRLSLVAAVLGLLGLLAYVGWFSPSVWWLLQGHFLEGQPGLMGFWFHYLSLLLVMVLLVLLYRNVSQANPLRPFPAWLLVWLLCLTAVYIASSELLFHVIRLNLPAANAAGGTAAQLAALTRQTNKVGFPILWGLCAFTLMFAGLRQKNKNLRILALCLFSITLLKLFVYDIRGISEGGKIAAFISLGVLLLVISFMYQNLKRLILRDETAPEADN